MLITNIHLIRAIDELDQNSIRLINTTNRLTGVGLAVAWIVGGATVLCTGVAVLQYLRR